MNKKEILINNIKNITENQIVQELLVELFDKILSKQKNIDYFFKENNNKIIHIRDWITSIIENNGQWKIPRVLTIDALNNAADKYFEKQNNKIQTIELDETHEKFVADLGEYYIVQMLTPEALDKESKVMQHCIGEGYYDKNLNIENYKYLSLRDKFNKAHVTIEVKNNEIIQLQGKQNALPDFKYLEILLLWLIENKYKFDLSTYKIIFNKNDNKIYSAYEMPNNCKIDGDLNLIGLNIKKLPSGLIVNGSLNLSGSRIEEIPEDIKIGKDLVVFDCEYLRKLPDNLKINGSLKFGFNLKELNKRIEINGPIFFENIIFEKDLLKDSFFENDVIKLNELITFLTKEGFKINLTDYDLIVNHNDYKIYSVYELPDNCRVEHRLNLWGLDIKKLPDNLTINDELNLKRCQDIDKLPDNLVVNGDLIIDFTKIQKIPRNLKVSKKLKLYGTSISLNDIDNKLLKDDGIDIIDLVNNLIKNGYKINTKNNNLLLNKNDNRYYNKEFLPDNCEIDGNVDFSYFKIYCLPNNLIVNGDLNLNGSSFEKMSRGLVVNGDLSLELSKNKELPDNIKILKSLNLNFSDIQKIPDDLDCGSDITLMGCDELIKIPDKFEVNGSLWMSNCVQLKKISDDLIVHGDFILSECNNLEKISDKLIVNGSLKISNCPKLLKLSDKIKCKKISINKDKIFLIKENMDFDEIEVENEGYSLIYNKEKFFENFDKQSDLFLSL